MVALAHVLAREALQRGITDRAPHLETALAVLDRLGRLAFQVVVVDQIGVDAGQPRLVPELAGQPLRFPRDVQHVVQAAELQ